MPTSTSFASNICTEQNFQENKGKPLDFISTLDVAWRHVLLSSLSKEL